MHTLNPNAPSKYAKSALIPKEYVNEANVNLVFRFSSSAFLIIHMEPIIATIVQFFGSDCCDCIETGLYGHDSGTPAESRTRKTSEIF